jgi:hypothetical protein
LKCPAVADPSVDKADLAKKSFVLILGIVARIDAFGLVAAGVEHKQKTTRFRDKKTAFDNLKAVSEFGPE